MTIAVPNIEKKTDEKSCVYKTRSFPWVDFGG